MSLGTIDDAALGAEIGRLPDLSLLELRDRWKTLFGHPAPKSLRRNFLARAVAYQMQVEAYGGLSVTSWRPRGSGIGSSEGRFHPAELLREEIGALLGEGPDGCIVR
jgi:hypothetical protein